MKKLAVLALVCAIFAHSVGHAEEVDSSLMAQRLVRALIDTMNGVVTINTESDWKNMIGKVSPLVSNDVMEATFNASSREKFNQSLQNILLMHIQAQNYLLLGAQPMLVESVGQNNFLVKPYISQIGFVYQVDCSKSCVIQKIISPNNTSKQLTDTANQNKADL